MKYLATVLASVLLASVTAVGVSALDPSAARAADGGRVHKCGGGTIFLKAEERRAFLLHNRIRRKHNMKPFCVHPALEEAARAHSRDMIRHDYFAHHTRGGGSFERRLKRHGYSERAYDYYLVAENIAGGNGGYGRPTHIMHSWMKSRHHRHNILDHRLRQIGIGASTGTFRKYSGWTMYTADFGVRHK
jgi:uncharacterized protein YkwD